jgi:hypothetical protein
MLETYKPSGQVGAMCLLMAAPLVAAGMAAAWLYQFLIEVIPIIYVDWALVFGFAFLLGAMCQRGLMAGRCRNAFAGGAVGTAVGVAAVIAGHYFAYLDTAAALGRPVSFAEYLRLRMDTGWSIGHVGSSSSAALPIKGLFVWVVWALEGGLIVFGAVKGAAGVAALPFCESCGRWADRKDAELTVSRLTPDTPGRVANAQDVDDLLDARAGGAAEQSLAYRLCNCPACGKLPTVSVRFSETVSNGKKSATNSRWLHRHVMLTEAEAAEVRGRATSGVCTPAAAA